MIPREMDACAPCKGDGLANSRLFQYLCLGVIRLLLSIADGPLQAQDSAVISRKYPVEALHEDLDVLNNSLRRCHPQYYAFVSKPAMDAFYDSLKSQITDSLDEFRFRFYTRQAMAKIGCGHVGIKPSKDYEAAAKSITRLVLPIDAWLIDDRVFVSRYYGDDSLLRPGDEVLQVNGKPIQGLLDTMRSTIPTDGANQTYLTRSIERNFAVAHAICNGFQAQHTLQIRNLQGITETVRTAAIPATRLASVKDRPAGWLIDSSHTRFKMDASNPRLGILDIDRFSGKKQGQIFHDAFKTMRQQGATGLVLDLRGNPGGNIFRGNKLLSYMLKGPLIRFVFFHRWRPSLLARHMRTSFINRFTPFLFALNPIQYPRKGGWAHEFWFLSKCRNRFRGDVYVLTDGGSFSMASYVAANLQHRRQSTTIGEETGGGEIGNNGMASLDILLPNTGVRMFLNLYHVQNTFKTDNKDHGVMPDIPLQYSLEDRLMGRDPMLEKARERSLGASHR